MFFFRVTLASFDDEKKVFFMFPDQQALDENGTPPFSEKDLCSHQIFKRFVKDTKTSIVDVSYNLFKTTANVSSSLNDEEYEQLKKDNKLSELDNNDISIITNKKKSSSGGKKSNNTSFYLIIAGMALLVIALFVISMKTSTNNEQSTSSTSNISETSNSIMEEILSSDISSLS